jgi:hypothetical protein
MAHCNFLLLFLLSFLCLFGLAAVARGGAGARWVRDVSRRGLVRSERVGCRSRELSQREEKRSVRRKQVVRTGQNKTRKKNAPDPVKNDDDDPLLAAAAGASSPPARRLDPLAKCLARVSTNKSERAASYVPREGGRVRGREREVKRKGLTRALAEGCF